MTAATGYLALQRAPRTSVPRLGIRRRPRPQTERACSPFAQFSRGVSTYVFPGNALGWPSQDPACPLFDFNGPSRFDIFGINVLVVETRKKLGGHIGAFIRRKREGLTKKFLRALSHVVILASSQLSNLRWSRRRSSSGCLSCRWSATAQRKR
jgi:hypothetical protein